MVDDCWGCREYAKQKAIEAEQQRLVALAAARDAVVQAAKEWDADDGRMLQPTARLKVAVRRLLDLEQPARPSAGPGERGD